MNNQQLLGLIINQQEKKGSLPSSNPAQNA
jgi:hypothetical protein